MKKKKIDYNELHMRKIAGKKGAHYCPDWDFLAICAEDEEMEACLCYSKEQDGDKWNIS